MILMWLGSFVLMVTGLFIFQQKVGSFFSQIQKSILDKGFSASTPMLFVQSLAMDLLEGSPQRASYSGLGLLNLRVLGTRPAVLMMCLSPLAALPVLGLGSLYLGFNGYFLLGLCLIGFFKYWRSSRIDEGIAILFGAGMFLVGSEMLLRNARVLQTILTDADLIFFISDGRFGAVLVMIALAFLLGLLIQLEFWSLALGLTLLSGGIISYNGALGMLLGERLAVAALFWWRTRKLNQECQQLGWQYAAVLAVSAMVGFWWAGEARTFLDLGFSLDSSAAQEKVSTLVSLFSLILGVQLAGGMIWGHFAGNRKADELQDPRYLDIAWLERGLFSQGQRSWAKERVQKRLSEIRYHLAGLKSLKEGQVPDHIQARLQEEERQLSALHI